MLRYIKKVNQIVLNQCKIGDLTSTLRVYSERALYIISIHFWKALPLTLSYAKLSTTAHNLEHCLNKHWSGESAQI